MTSSIAAGVVVPLPPGDGPLPLPQEKLDVGAELPHLTDPFVVPGINVLGFAAAGRLGNISSFALGPIVLGAAVDGTPPTFDGVDLEAAVPVAQARGSLTGFLEVDWRAG